MAHRAFAWEHCQHLYTLFGSLESLQ